MNPQFLFVGMDAGGTKTRVAFSRFAQNPPAYLDGPGINLKRDGLEQSANACLKLLENVLARQEEDCIPILCAGIAGAGRAAEREVLRLKIASKLPPKGRVMLYTDAEIAYFAAHGEQSGILLITGTGSIFLAKTPAGDFVRAGGWGSVLGDEAGGYQLGRAGLAAIAHALDGGPSTMLQQLLQKNAGVSSADELITYTYAPDTIIQHTAPLVLLAAEAGDAVAQGILDTQLAALTHQLTWLLNRHPDIALSLVHIGGLSNNGFYSQHLTSQLQTTFPDLTFIPSSISPADAALTIAQKPLH